MFELSVQLLKHYIREIPVAPEVLYPDGLTGHEVLFSFPASLMYQVPTALVIPEVLSSSPLVISEAPDPNGPILKHHIGRVLAPLPNGCYGSGSSCVSCVS